MSKPTRFPGPVTWRAMTRWLVTVSIVCLGPPASAGQVDVKRVVTPEGNLIAALELRDAQGGFVGTTGTVWHVEPDGTFLVARFVNERVMAPAQEGRLRREDIASVAEALVAQKFASLPSEIGKPTVNARRLVLRFGNRSSAVVLEPTEGLDEAVVASRREPQSERARLLAIAHTIVSLLEKQDRKDE